MVQNRNKLINLFIGNISNSIIHKILEKAIDDKEIANRYEKELITSFEVAKRYRSKINPANIILPDKDIKYIRDRIIKNVRSDLLMRIKKGYKNINLNLIEELVDRFLKETKVI